MNYSISVETAVEILEKLRKKHKGETRVALTIAIKKLKREYLED